MASDSVAFYICTFISGLFLLEYGADLFVENTAISAKRLGVSEVLVALLTAGAEWEELVVVVSSLITHRPSLAIGNVVGSAISNVLGAFSLGLLFQSGEMIFDKSAKTYSLLLLYITSIVSVLFLLHAGDPTAGVCLIASFIVYVAVVCWSIYRGVLDAPEDSDTDSDADSSGFERGDSCAVNENNLQADVDESTTLLPIQLPQKSLLCHLSKLLLGFITLSISGYVLSSSAQALATSLGISDSVFGATILSVATTLPEKFVAVMSGSRNNNGILVSNTVGSNIFLLTLCLGVILVSSSPGNFSDVKVAEVSWLWVSSLALALVTLFGARRWMGIILLLSYISFLVLELTIFRG